jgi:hypothetical protein
MLKGHVRGKEGDERGLGIQAEGVIIKVDRMELWQSKESSQE